MAGDDFVVGCIPVVELRTPRIDSGCAGLRTGIGGRNLGLNRNARPLDVVVVSVTHTQTPLQTQTPLKASAALGLVMARPILRVKLLFLLASFISLVLSVGLWFTGNEQQGLFVGIWVPSILSLGALLVAGDNGGDR